MCEYEDRLSEAQEKDKTIYYDYIGYKKVAGWWSGCEWNDWHRPITINKARYDASFLSNIPNYYFLGFPINELLKNEYSNGHCHACAVALSLCFNDFEIVTANLLNYVDFYNEILNRPTNTFEHTFLTVNVNGKKMVIDTSSSMITDYDTYKEIFRPVDVRIITSEQIRKTEPYKYLESLIHYVGPSIDNITSLESNGEQYSNIIDKYIDMCDDYVSDDENLMDFINRRLLSTSNGNILRMFRCNYLYSSIHYEYPDHNMFSLIDDEFDNNLYSTVSKTNKENEKIIEGYHNPKVYDCEVPKVARKLKTIINNLK